MADNPFAKYALQAVGGNPFAKYASQEPSPEPVGLGEMAADVGKSAGMGLAQGALAFATLPGNLEALARTGIDAGARAVGLEDPRLSERTFLNTYNDYKDAIERKLGTSFYEPKTTLGKYARTGGEFASLAVGGPVSLASKAARVAGPAIASETAGQLTEGTEAEPWARLAGGMVGTKLPGAALKTATPNPVSAERARQAAVLESEGVKSITAGQKTGSMPLRWAESIAVDTPFSGKRAGAMLENQAEEFTAAVLKKAGVNGRLATDDVMNKAFTDIGSEYNILARGSTLGIGNATRLRLKTIASEYEESVGEAFKVPLVRKVADEIATGPFLMNGEKYGMYRSKIEAARRGLKGDYHASEALGRIRETLDSTLVASAPASQRGQVRRYIKDLNRRYRNLLVVEDARAAAGEKTALGLLSPSAVRNASKRQNKRSFVRGTGDMAKLANAGEAIMKPLPNSGTGPRSFWQQMGAGVGAAMGFGAGGGLGAVAGAMAPAVGVGTLGRVATSRPMQRYMANQRYAGQSMAYEPQSVMAQAPQALMQTDNARTGTGNGEIVGRLVEQVAAAAGVDAATAEMIIRQALANEPASKRSWKRALARAEKDPAYLAKIVQRLISSGLAGLTQTVQETP